MGCQGPGVLHTLLVGLVFLADFCHRSPIYGVLRARVVLGGDLEVPPHIVTNLVFGLVRPAVRALERRLGAFLGFRARYAHPFGASVALPVVFDLRCSDNGWQAQGESMKRILRR